MLTPHKSPSASRRENPPVQKPTLDVTGSTLNREASKLDWVPAVLTTIRAWYSWPGVTAIVLDTQSAALAATAQVVSEIDVAPSES